MASFIGDSGDNSFVGTASSDDFDLSQGGDDTADGAGGSDSFSLGASFTAADRLTGGAGIDDLQLDGDYSAGVVMTDATLVGFEAISLAAGHDYSLTLDDAAATTADLGYFNINATTLGVGDQLIFDGSAETDTILRIHGGAAGDVLTGGQNGNLFDLFMGGDDTCLGGAGQDIFSFEGTSFGRFDHIDGAANSVDGGDTLNLDGDYSTLVRFRQSTMVNVETISLFGSHSYALKVADATTAAGETLTVSAGTMIASQFLKFIGKFESNGFLVIDSGAGDDTLVGGGLGDTISGGDGKDRILGKGGFDLITGGHGADVLSGGAGADTFVFRETADSTNTKSDLIVDLQKIDVIDLSQIDADSVTAGDQAFVLVASFGHHAGEATLSYDGGTDRTSLLLDTDGDGAADATILIAGDHTTHSNFVL